MYTIYIHWNEFFSLLFLYDVYKKIHDNVEWPSELWWDPNATITSL